MAELFFTHNLFNVQKLQKAGYDTVVTAVGDGYNVAVDLGLTPFDAPQWHRALIAEVKGILNRGRSPWA